MTPTSIGLLLRTKRWTTKAASSTVWHVINTDMLVTNLMMMVWFLSLAFLQQTGISHPPWPESFACCLVNNLILLR